MNNNPTYKELVEENMQLQIALESAYRQLILMDEEISKSKVYEKVSIPNNLPGHIVVNVDSKIHYEELFNIKPDLGIIDFIRAKIVASLMDKFRSYITVTVDKSNLNNITYRASLGIFKV